MKLIVKPIANGPASGVVLHDALTGAILPNQTGGRLDYEAQEVATLSVSFLVDGDYIRMWTGEPLAEIAAANDLQAAARSYAGLSPANRARFLVMHDLERRAETSLKLCIDASSLREDLARAISAMGRLSP